MVAPVGFIGLGIMGLGQARNLVAALATSRSGRVDRSAAKAEAFSKEEEAAGNVTVVASAAEVVQRCSATYSMLSTLEDTVELRLSLRPS